MFYVLEHGRECDERIGVDKREESVGIIQVNEMGKSERGRIDTSQSLAKMRHDCAHRYVVNLTERHNQPYSCVATDCIDTS